MKNKIIIAALLLVLVLALYIFYKKKKEAMLNETIKYFSKKFEAAKAKQLAHLFDKYFSWKEFDSPDAPGSAIKNISPTSLAKLLKAREASRVPFKINSAFRTIARNAEVGGRDNSAHTRGHAFDVAVNAGNRNQILKSLIDAGFTRIGIYPTFIHADDDPTLPQYAYWGKDGTSASAPFNPFKLNIV